MRPQPWGEPVIKATMDPISVAATLAIVASGLASGLVPYISHYPCVLACRVSFDCTALGVYTAAGSSLFLSR